MDELRETIARAIYENEVEKALRAVLERHRPRPNTVSALFPYPLCECMLEWGDDGCPTVTEIKEELSDE